MALWSAFRPVATRFLHSILTLWLITILFFLIVEMIPGDFAIATATQETTQEMIAATRFQLGLYDSAPVRYFRWLTDALSGDLGISWWTRSPIVPLVGERLWHSAWLFGWAVLVTLPLSLVLAVCAVIKPHNWFDRVSSFLTLSVLSVPEFVVAYAFMFILAVQFDVFPAYTMYALNLPWTERLYATTLPILSLIAVTVTPIFRLTRAALLDVLNKEFIQLAEIKGIPRGRILVKHAFPNAVGPVATAVALGMANLFFGLVIVEIVYSYPGLGKLLITAARLHDVPLVQACALIAAIVYISLNFIADTVSVLANPKLRFPIREQANASVRFQPLRAIALEPGLAAFGTIACAGVVAVAWALWPASSEKSRPEVTVSPAADGVRDKLKISDLLDPNFTATMPIHYKYFGSYDSRSAAPAKLSGVLEIPRSKLRYRNAWTDIEPLEADFPSFSLRLVSHGDVLLPLDRGEILWSANRAWNIILSPGKIWRETADLEWSRAAFPFTILPEGVGVPRYGVATFAYTDQKVSQLRIQIAQESANWSQKDFWGQTAITFGRKSFEDAGKARAAYDRQEVTRLDIRPWSELASNQWRSIEDFDGKGNRRNITVSGLMVDDIVYLRRCRTRAGAHPFCRQMRHPVFSIAKSLGAGVAMLWLAQKYGPEVFDEKIVDHIIIPARHNGWKDVTFGYALDMVTGIGNVTPQKVDEYVEADQTQMMAGVRRAPTLEGKLKAIAEFRNYPWGPGEVFRYRSSDTIVLAAAMHAFIRKKEGPDADFWDLLTKEVFVPLGIQRLPVIRTREEDGSRGTPILGSGMFPTIEEALKIARLLQDHGRHKGKQFLHEGLTRRAVSNDLDRGYPNGWTTGEGGKGRYEMSFWLHPHLRWFSCDVRIPTMSGSGGNYISIMPNRTIGLRFADGHDDDRYTWDSSGIRNVSSRIRPFCQ